MVILLSLARDALLISLPLVPRGRYALKSYLVFGTAELYTIWNASYHAALTHLKVGPWYGESNMHAGKAEVRV